MSRTDNQTHNDLLNCNSSGSPGHRSSLDGSFIQDEDAGLILNLNEDDVRRLANQWLNVENSNSASLTNGRMTSLNGFGLMETRFSSKTADFGRELIRESGNFDADVVAQLDFDEFNCRDMNALLRSSGHAPLDENGLWNSGAGSLDLAKLLDGSPGANCCPFSPQGAVTQNDVDYDVNDDDNIADIDDRPIMAGTSNSAAGSDENFSATVPQNGRLLDFYNVSRRDYHLAFNDVLAESGIHSKLWSSSDSSASYSKSRWKTFGQTGPKNAKFNRSVENVPKLEKMIEKRGVIPDDDRRCLSLPNLSDQADNIHIKENLAIFGKNRATLNVPDSLSISFSKKLDNLLTDDASFREPKNITKAADLDADALAGPSQPKKESTNSADNQSPDFLPRSITVDDYEYHEFFVNGKYIDMNHNELGYTTPTPRSSVPQGSGGWAPKFGCRKSNNLSHTRDQRASTKFSQKLPEIPKFEPMDNSHSNNSDESTCDSTFKQISLDFMKLPFKIPPLFPAVEPFPESIFRSPASPKISDFRPENASNSREKNERISTDWDKKERNFNYLPDPPEPGSIFGRKNYRHKVELAKFTNLGTNTDPKLDNESLNKRDSGLGGSSTTNHTTSDSKAPIFNVHDWDSLATLLPENVAKTCLFFAKNSSFDKTATGIEESMRLRLNHCHGHCPTANKDVGSTIKEDNRTNILPQFHCCYCTVQNDCNQCNGDCCLANRGLSLRLELGHCCHCVTRGKRKGPVPRRSSSKCCSRCNKHHWNCSSVCCDNRLCQSAVESICRGYCGNSNKAKLEIKRPENALIEEDEEQPISCSSTTSSAESSSDESCAGTTNNTNFGSKMRK